MAIGGFLALAIASSIVAALLWAGRALAVVEEPPVIGCLASSDRDKLASGGFSLRDRDYFVTSMANYRKGVPRSSEWHMRGALIHLTYTTFWSQPQRDALFDDLVAKMEPCPPRDRRAGS